MPELSDSKLENVSEIMCCMGKRKRKHTVHLSTVLARSSELNIKRVILPVD